MAVGKLVLSSRKMGRGRGVVKSHHRRHCRDLPLLGPALLGVCGADLMYWKKSTMPSVFSRSSWAWMQMKVPVRPTPSLGEEGGSEAELA